MFNMNANLSHGEYNNDDYISTDEEYISYTADELNAKVDEKEAQRSSLVGLLLKVLKSARDSEETLDMEPFAKIVYAKINSMGGNSAKLEAMLSPLFQLCYLSRTNKPKIVNLLALSEETEGDLKHKLNELHRLIDESEAKINEMKQKMYIDKLVLANTLVHIFNAEADIAATKEVCKEADFTKLRLSEFYDHAEEDLERFMDESGNWFLVLVHLQCSKKCLEEEIFRCRDLLVLERRALKHLRMLERRCSVALTAIASKKKRAKCEIARVKYITHIGSLFGY